MRAAVMEGVRKPLVVRDVPEQLLPPNGARVRVEANGICRTDWHIWTGDWTWLGIAVPTPCGMICWGAPGFLPENPPTWNATVPTNYVDCVAYGGYTGTNVPPVAGRPTPLSAGDATLSLTRTGSSANNANDFALACPTPTTNNGAIGDFRSCSTTTTTLVTTTTTTITTTTTSSTSTSTSSSTSSTTSTTSTSSSSTSTTSTSTTMPAPVGQLLRGTALALRVKAGKPAKSSVAVLSKDTAITLGAGNGSADDPTLNGGSLRLVSSAAGAFDHPYPLAGSWKYLGKAGQNKGYKWKSTAGPVTGVLVKKGKLLKAAGHGELLGLALGENPNPVSVVLEIGGHRFCLEFGGSRKFIANKFYVAGNAPPPAACPR